MARKKEERSYFNLGDDWKVANVRDLEFGLYFTLQLPGLSLYNLKVVPGTKKYDTFIGIPEVKGNDGNWHKVYNLFLSDDDVADIIAEVEKAASKKDIKL